MFESLLARRYIFSQKRHTILTICSIAISLALITMLFTGFSTGVKCWRNAVYEREGAYHVSVPVSEEEAKAVAEYFADYGTCTFEEDFFGGIYAKLLFDEYIGDLNIFMDRMFGAVGMSPMTHYGKNDALMMLDMIDLTARAELAIIFAVFYIFVLFFIMALRLVIDTAFEISSKERERQFGVLQSIGATPKQIVRIITFEGLTLSVIGIPIGVILGIVFGYIAYRAVLGSGLPEAYFTPEKAAELFHFHVNPWLILFGMVTGLVWVLLSAYGTGMRIIRMSPIQAISARSNTVKKVKKHSLFGLLFGWTGKLAARNNSRQPKRFLITVISLTLSITLFASVSVIIDRMQYDAMAERALETRAGTMDFGISFTRTEEGIFDPLRYREPFQKIIESGYFTNIDFVIPKNAKSVITRDDRDDGIYYPIFIYYYYEDTYNQLFDGEPPISYDELTKQGGYVLLKDGRHIVNIPHQIEGLDTISGYFTKYNYMTEEKYNSLSPEEQELAKESICNSYYTTEEQPTDLKISCEAEIYGGGIYYETGVEEGYESRYIFLAGTLDEYENIVYDLFGNDGSHMSLMACDLADEEQYEEALDFLENSPGFYLDDNNYAEYRRIMGKFAAIRVGVAFLNIMIALIAIVNMVNILSTGILNRRGELAAMQCVGMTERQLYKMTIVECLQYVISAGIMAIILCELLKLGTEELLTHMDLMGSAESFSQYAIVENFDSLSYLAPLPKIGIAAVLAFIAALLASMIPLRRMQKTSLVEQIQSTD